jgi:hypothetical protein
MAKFGATTSNKALPRAKHVTIESPSNSEDITLFYTDEALEVTKIVAILTGSSSPSLTWSIRFHSDRSNAGTEIVTGGTVIDETDGGTSTGKIITSFNNSSISANNWIWFKTTANSGTVNKVHLTIFYD